MNPITKRITDFLSHYIDLDPVATNENDGKGTTTTAGAKNTTTQPTTRRTRSTTKKASPISLGIWSGHLSLQQVRLRNDTMNQLLQQYCVSPPHRRRKRRPSREVPTSSLQWRLVSGTIGSLEIQIPWKQFLLSAGGGGGGGANSKNSSTSKKDTGTKVTLQNVVLVVTLDPYPQHHNNTKDTEQDGDDDEDDPSCILDDDDHTSTHDSDTPEERRRHRKQKQLFLLEIEKRLRSSPNKNPDQDPTTTATTPSISDFIAHVQQRERLLQDKRRRQQQKQTGNDQNNNENDTTSTTANAVLRRNEYWLSTYLRNLTNDLLYTLLVNVSVQIHHFQIVVVVPQYNHHSTATHDPHNATVPFIELGCIIPSLQMTNDGRIHLSDPMAMMMMIPPSPPKPTTNAASTTATTTAAGMATSSDSDRKEDDDEDEELHRTKDPIPTTALSMNHVNSIEKYIQIKGMGCYIRTGTTTTTTTTTHADCHNNPFLSGTATDPHIADTPVHTKDFMIHPFDIDFHGTLVLPSAAAGAAVTVEDPPPLVDRKRKSHTTSGLQRATTVDSTTMIRTMNHNATSTTTAKRQRRGKRDKEEVRNTVIAPTNTKRVIVNVPTTITEGKNQEDETNPPLFSTTPIRHQPIESHLVDTYRTSLLHRHHHRRVQTLESTPRRSWLSPMPRSAQPPMRTSIMGRRPSLRRNSTLGRTISLYENDDDNDDDVLNDRLPLAQPNDLGAFYLSRKRSNVEDSSSTAGTNDMTANTNHYTELNGSLSISAIHAVCTSTHYQLLQNWYATTVKLRNGRPFVSIRTVLRQQMLLENSSITKLVTDPTVDDPLSYNPQILVWWKYVYGVIVQELRERKRSRVIFQKMFLSFDWSKQSRYRSEYVKAYIQCRLQQDPAKAHNTSTARPATLRLRSVTFGTTPSKSLEDRILVIEDVLPVEQIVLYRSIARKVHAKGFVEMPLSFLEVNDDTKTVMDGTDMNHHSDESNAKVEPQLPQSTSTNFISTLGQLCEITRARCYSTIGAVIPEYPPELQKPSPKNATTVGETSKLGLRSVTSRTSKTNRTATSNTDRSYGGVASTAMDHISNSTAIDSKNFKITYTFTVQVQKIELLIIEEESILKGSQPSDDALNSNGDSFDDTNRSADNISLLTDDDVQSLQINPTGDWKTDGEAVDTIASSTDYLLFEIPKRVLLQLELTQLKCSILGDSSTSRCFSFRLGHVKAIGNDNLTLMWIGQGTGDVAPLDEVVISSNSGAVSTYQRRRTSTVTNDALVVSLVISTNHTFLQCDAPTIQAVVDVTTLKKLILFRHVNAATLPRSLLDRQPREIVRLYVMKQNKVEFPDLNCSVRIQGCDISLLHEARIIPTNTGDNITTEAFSQVMNLNSTVALRCNMIEMYSGTAVIELSDQMDEWQTCGMPSESVGVSSKSEPSTVTRRLSMLDLPTLLAESPSMLCFHSVVTMNGIDIVISPSLSMPLSLFHEPLSLEVLYTLKSESLLNLNEAKEKIVAEVSPVHILISEDRILGIAKSDIVDQFEQLSTLPSGADNDNANLPPRLEVLSSFFHYTFLFSIRAMRFSIFPGSDHGDTSTLTSHKLVLEDIIKDFLNVVSVYDINFPHEAAVDAAMNICIDRLASIGLPRNDAWEAANLVILHFIDEVEGQDPLESRHVIDTWEYDQQSRISAVENAVLKTSALIIDQLDNVYHDQSRLQSEIFLEFPGGLTFSCVSLFYDRHYKVIMPSLLVGNSDGFHFLRISPPEVLSETSECTSDDSLSENSAQHSNTSAVQKSIQNGTIFRLFSLDRGYRFGKGGMPLSSLGSDAASDVAADRRIREQLLDFNIGDLELLFLPAVSIDAIDNIQQLMKPLQKLLNHPALHEGTSGGGKSVVSDTYFFANTSSLSSLLLSDDHSPFIRFSLGDFVVASKQVIPSGKEAHEWISHFFSKSIRLVNLTREGQLFPEIVESLPNGTGFCVSLSIDPTSGIDIVANSLRLCVLRQFLNEALQYFTTRQHGIGRLLHHLAQDDSKRKMKDAKMNEKRVTLHDVSIIIPRSCHCYDMVGVEVTKLILTFPAPTKSFSMPTSTSSLDFNDVNVEDKLAKKISRIVISICGFKVYSALPDKMVANVHCRDSPSFRSVYELNGRAEALKHVFLPINNSSKAGLDENTDTQNDEKANRCWKEMTTSIASITVIVDNGPNLRILITDSYNVLATGLHLKVALSQFCLLQSIWFSNMQELPQLFPYSTESLQQGSGPLEKLEKIPDHGSEEFLLFLKNLSSVSSEVAVVLKDLDLNCIFDGEADETDQSTSTNAFVVRFGEAVVHIANDRHGIVRIGVGCKSVSLVDYSTVERVVLSAAADIPGNTWADLAFGLDLAEATLSTNLTQALQLSMFLMPNWNVYNLGLRSPNITLSDLAPIFRLLKYLSAYATDPAFGNPSFDISERIRQIKEDLFRNTSTHSRRSASSPSLEFRLWLYKPSLSIPFDSLKRFGPSLRVDGEGGLRYTYLTIDEVSSQECITDCLNFTVDGFAVIPNENVRYRNSARKLVENLCFGFRLDTNAVTRHTDICIKIPFVDSSAPGMYSSRVSLSPTILPLPTICSPYTDVTRSVGRNVCEMTCIVDVLPVVSKVLVKLFSTGDSGYQGSPDTDAANSVITFSMVASVSDVRIYILDPILGPHLPIAVLSVSTTTLSASQFAEKKLERQALPTDFFAEDLQISATSTVWADYFKLGMTRSWEPLLEPYRFRCDMETSCNRGSGLTFYSDSCLHINISSALLIVLDEVMDELYRMVKGYFKQDLFSINDFDDWKAGQVSHSNLMNVSFEGNEIAHEWSVPIQDEDRVAFSIRNMTGQKIRIVRPSTASLNVLYLRHAEATELKFPASISMVKNLRMTEVDFPGLPHDLDHRHVDIKQHTVDVQVPGFRWLEGIVVDTFGRKFARIVPLSKFVHSKIEKDWKIANVLHVLVEVGLRSGGRQVTVRSAISVINKTKHCIGILLHPDPLFTPDEKEHSETDHTTKMEAIKSTQNADYNIAPGEWFQVPILLLENALRQTGTHLGRMWIKPAEFKDKEVATSDNSSYGINFDDEVEYCSRPVPFTRLVNESANMLESSRFRDISSSSGVSKLQLSCPVTNRLGERAAPICYALEIDRSPIVADRTNSKQSTSPKHLPVAYSIIIHPPIIITNRLPCAGRFELMHAVNRSVLWSGDLIPGQEVSVHSVGLDAPLFLFMNIGFAKTPVGEGALVHHGPDPPPNIRDNLVSLKSIGKAGMAVTKRLGKTLTTIGESSDTRGLKRIFKAQNLRMPSAKEVKHGSPIERQVKMKTEEGEVDGKTYKIDNFHYFADDVAQHTTIVDGLGQRLTLNIENIRGGGGQRKVTVFSRFWIVNTTEHCLRYKQENSKLFVSGTVLSPEKDGSLPLNGARSQPKYGKHIEDFAIPSNEKFNRRIHAGMPGALATFPGRCEHDAETVAALLDTNMSIEEVAKWSFMFSFQEDHVNIGNQKLCVQLYDGTGSTRYISDWSRGFGVDSVGVAQTISLHCKDGRAVELNVVITVAPGVLANYTSIIRIVPRYAIVNNLPYPVRIWQDSSTFSNVGGSELTSKKASKWRSSIGDNDMSRINQYELLWGRPAVLNERQTAPAIGGTAARRSALYITTVYPSEIIPFCLPDSRGERQLRIDPGDPWDLSGSISTSKPGDFTLAMKQAVDSTAILHESSRASPHYEVRLPPHGTTSFDGDLGIWFESDYGANTGLIVKAIRKNSYCFNETEVHVGDELLYLNKIQLKGLAFDKAIDALKRHLFDLSSRRVDDGNVATPIKHGRNSIIRKSLRYQKDKDQPQQTSAAPSMVLTFRTVEERIRQVMIKAATTDTASYQSHEYFNRSRGSNETTRNGESSDSGFFIKAELKNYPRSHLGLFLVLREESTAPYELLNQSITYTIYYRQRDCDHLKWQFLKPGKSRRYAWDEPLKPKKLVIRVDSQNLFAHMGNLSVCNQSSDARKPLRSEDDVYFPKSALVPLDEVGYHETLSLQDTSVKNDSLKVPLCCLQFDVDVSRNHRILVVRDVPTDDSQRQMDQWLSELNQQVQHEEKRKNNLRDVTNRYTESNTATTMDFKRLVETNDLEDFFGQDDIVITECHQIFVEILEATGISSDTINASCNPYCDVRLKHGHNRNRLFGIRDRRRTYYIRKTFTPVWNKQSFVFHVPPEAAVVTRGYKLILRVRNYSPFRSHQVLGYARIDLHSVRDQKSHIGWFPLVGRNGRPELNTHGSHLGRGSVRVRVQWIYTMPALVQYFEILSESRIVAIQENISVIAKQLERLAESENEIRAGLDGIQAVRIEDLLSFPKYKRKENIDNLRRQKVKASTVKKNAGPLVSCEESLPESSSKKSQDYLTELPVLLRPHSHERGFKRTANSLHAIAHNLEKQISQKRLHRLNFTRHQFDEVLNTANGLIPLSLIRSWNMVQALLTDVDVEVKFNSNYIEATPRPNVLLSEASKALLGVYNPEVMNGIELKLYPPERAPRWMQTSTNAYINEWIKSRSSFDRTARISMKTVLHSGGWLSIRPITALNLPDVFTGMAVKIQYGSETYVSDTADIRSLDPSWYKINHRDSDAGDWELVSHNDMHIHIAPQLTSGTIRLSIIGEKKHKRPSSKTEIGVVYLPLGATVSCLLDCEESRLELLRWFPLSLVTARMEGDGGLGVRPPDTEKESDSDFKEYFAPCIQLALFWSPDNGNVSVNKITNDSQHTEGQKPLVQDSTESTNNQMNMERQPSFVKNYLNADIGWISAALIDSQRACELLSLNVKDVDLRFLVTSAKTRMGLTVGWLQVDYQDNDEREPVILSPTPTGVLSPVFQTLVVKDNLRSETDTLSFDFIDISIAELDFTVEERLLIDLMKFLSSLYARLRTNTMGVTTAGHRINSERAFVLHDDDTSTTSFASILMSKPSNSEKMEKIYIKELVIGVIKVNISYLKGSRIRDASADSSLSKVLRVASDELFQRFFYNEDNSDPYLAWSQSTFDADLQARSEATVGPQNLQQFVARLFPNISDAPLRLPGKSLKHQFETAADVVESIFKFYSTEALKQFYKIVGALDIVGNPTMLVTSLINGIRDFVLTPSAALMNSPRDPSRLGIGVAQGTLSFLSHGASGIFGYASKVAAAAGQGIASISLDNEFRDWHNDNVVVAATNLNREWKRRGVQNVGYIVTKPITDIALGFAGGITGVVISPIKGFQRSGTTGFIVGMGTGVIGIFAKPMVGLLDAATHFSASIHDIAKSVNVLDRRLQPVLKLRLPYTFGLMSVLSPYDVNDARATQILKKCPLKEGFKNTESGTLEYIIDVEILPSMGTEVFVIVTSLRVLLVRVKKESIGVWTTTTCHEIYFSDDALYSSKVDDYGHSSVALVVYKRTRDKSVRSESKRTGILFALSPQVAWKTVTSRFGGVVTSEQVIPNPDDIADGNSDLDDITGTDDEGTLIDKFTILADYQYQRELTRLHNVISCILGNYDSLIYDKWLSVGRECRTDGYTSFGMYFFERNDTPEIQTKYVRPTAALARLPWVGYHTFGKIGRSTVPEQKELIIKLRDESSFANELEAAEWEGGPAWLVAALANATYETFTYASPPLRKSSISSLRGTNGSESNSRTFPAIDFDNYDNSLALYNPRVASDVSNMLHQEIAAENFQSPLVANSTSYNDLRRSDPSMPKSSMSSHPSFHTADTTGSPNAERTFSSSESFRNSIWMDAYESEPNEVPTMDPSQFFSSTKQTTTVDDTRAKENDSTNLDSNRRLDRLEQLMERLLLFTADQTVLRHAPMYAMPPTISIDPQYTYTLSQQRLWNEINELRSMILHPTTRPAQEPPPYTSTVSDPNDTLLRGEASASSFPNDVLIVGSQQQPGYENRDVRGGGVAVNHHGSEETRRPPPLVDDNVPEVEVEWRERPDHPNWTTTTQPTWTTIDALPHDHRPTAAETKEDTTHTKDEWSVEQVD